METTYNALTSAPVVNLNLPVVYYANSSLVFKNVSEACDVKVYNTTGQLLSSFVVNEESTAVKIDYSGLIIVSLQMADRNSMKFKLIVFRN